ncbi:hypothetical protein Tco_1326106, partial [Tanacetum coccineum]
NPGECHWNVVKNILKYLRNTKDTFLVYGGNLDGELRVTCYTDAGYETDADDLKSQTGYIRKFIDGLGVVPTNNEPIEMFCDNFGAIIIANEPGVQKGAKHYRRKVHYIREVIEEGDISLFKVHTDDNVVDHFPEALPCTKHVNHAKSIGLRPASSFMYICFNF